MELMLETTERQMELMLGTTDEMNATGHIYDVSWSSNALLKIESEATFNDVSVARWIEACVVMVIALVAMVGNTSLWIIVLHTKFKMWRMSNVLILCLSGADLLVSSVTMPMLAYTILGGDWMFSHFVCVTMGFITMVTFIASVMSLASISINRYVAVCRPFYLARRYTPQKTALWVTGVWLLSALLASPPLIGWCEYDYLASQSFCFAHWSTSVSYTLFMVGVCFGGPCTCMIYCYVHIFIERHRLKLSLSEPQNNMDSAQHGSLSALQNNTESTQHGPLSALQVSTDSTQHGKQKHNGMATNEMRINNRARPPIHLPQGTSEEGTVRAVHADEVTVELFGEVGSSGNAKGFMNKKVANNCVNLNNEPSNAVIELEPHYTLVANSNINSCISAKDKYCCYDNKQTGECPTSKQRACDHQNYSNKSNGTSQKNCVNNKTTNKLRRSREMSRSEREELRLTMSLLVAMVMFIVCWFPFCVTMFYSVFSHAPVAQAVDLSTLMLGCLNSCLNPIIYGAMNRKFNQAFRKLYQCSHTEL